MPPRAPKTKRCGVDHNNRDSVSKWRRIIDSSAVPALCLHATLLAGGDERTRRLREGLPTAPALPPVPLSSEGGPRWHGRVNYPLIDGTVSDQSARVVQRPAPRGPGLPLSHCCLGTDAHLPTPSPIPLPAS
ncbi:hypothetical protein DPEC_G00356330 [Dallia pectoralis]|uniref:Uncharacterized protein n=1 Tax=Dallia pectoralis TaxID=75939 RepID=A0ACC2EZS5_DALPE|nr:hypothetical protein DPEC_G00356330 [Dallia pectoralis]